MTKMSWASADLVQHLGALRFEPRALARGHDDDSKFHSARYPWVEKRTRLDAVVLTAVDEDDPP
jgi:hypothetical protein